MDAKLELTRVAILNASAIATNNQATAGVDLKGFIGDLAVTIDLGAPTAGDASNRSITYSLFGSATNSAGAATALNIAAAAVTNNATLQVLTLNQRAVPRYLFAIPVIAGGNAPSWPVSILLEGKKNIQP